MKILLILTIFLLLSKLACADIVIQTIAREAGNQPFKAQIAVAEVIKTRAKERKQTPEQVCLAKYQFSCWNKGVKQKPRTKKELETATLAWKGAKANGINLYHDKSVKPKWAKSKWVKFVKREGDLFFYREIR